MSNKFDALVAELAGHTQPERATETHRKISVVHRISQEGLGMQSIGHVNALPPVRLDGEVNDVSRLRQESRGVQELVQGRADPLGDIGPALLAHYLGDLAADR